MTDKEAIQVLRSALIILIGCDTDQELEDLRAVMRLMPGPDTMAGISAVEALLLTRDYR